MSLPVFTHSQFLLLSLIGNNERRTKVLIDGMEETGEAKSPSALSSLIHRINLKRIEKQLIAYKMSPEGERVYYLTDSGKSAYNQQFDFYRGFHRLGD